MKSLIGMIIIVGTALVAAPAAADDFEATGSIRVQTNAQYASVIKDGAPWEDTEYLNGGKTVVITEIALDKLPVTFTIIARDKPEFGPQEVTATRKDFRKKRKGRTYSWVYQTKIRFKKAKKKAAPDKKKGTKAPPAEPAKPATPQKDEDDDL